VTGYADASIPGEKFSNPARLTLTPPIRAVCAALLASAVARTADADQGTRMKTTAGQPILSISLGSVWAATQGSGGGTLFDTAEKVRMGAPVRYTSCCM
jgi:hypothetical protein